MLKVDRQAFLALALGMQLAGCYTSTTPMGGQPMGQPRQTPGPANEMAPSHEGHMAPAQECTGWTPTGECNKWEPRNEMAPAQECTGWTPTGECNKWEPRKEY
jgi:hypothetical protein